MKKRNKTQKTLSPAKTSSATKVKQPFIEHVYELRRRLFYMVACVAIGSAVAYSLEHKLINILLRPSHGQNFIYTSPLGGINFLFGVCLDIGLVVATPVIIYQLLAFMQPMMRDTTRRFLLIAASVAGLVAIAGVLFGYFIGLPSALNFLLHQFTAVQIRPLITIQSYMQFVALYLFGSALMFQLPLILLIINRIKPLKPSKLFKYERYLIVFAFIAAFIMNPTPNLIDQMLVVVPIIIMYQVGIALIWFVNRHEGSTELELLRAQDAARQAERASRTLKPYFVATTPVATIDSTDASTAEEEVTNPAVAIQPKAPEAQLAAKGDNTMRRSTTLPLTTYLPLRRQLVQ